MKWKFTGKERTFTCGRHYLPGQVIESEQRPNKLFEKVKKINKEEKNSSGGLNNVMES